MRAHGVLVAASRRTRHVNATVCASRVFLAMWFVQVTGCAVEMAQAVHAVKDGQEIIVGSRRVDVL
jgi:hypothetical protein